MHNQYDGLNITPRLQCARCSTFVQALEKPLSIQRFTLKKCNSLNHTWEPVTNTFPHGSLIISLSLFLYPAPPVSVFETENLHNSGWLLGFKHVLLCMASSTFNFLWMIRFGYNQKTKHNKPKVPIKFTSGRIIYYFTVIPRYL